MTSKGYSDDPSTYAPFAFSPQRLASLLDPKDVPGLRKLGGTEALIDGLGTHSTRGLATSSLEQGPRTAHDCTLEDRQRVFGTNTLPIRRVKSLLQLMWLALQNRVLVCYFFLPRIFIVTSPIVSLDFIVCCGSHILGSGPIPGPWHSTHPGAMLGRSHKVVRQTTSGFHRGCCDRRGYCDCCLGWQFE